MAGLVDQLARRRESGKDTCDLTEQREGKLVRESAVQDSPDMSGDRALRLHDFSDPLSSPNLQQPSEHLNGIHAGRFQNYRLLTCHAMG